MGDEAEGGFVGWEDGFGCDRNAPRVNPWGEAEELVRRLGHPVGRAGLSRYARTDRLTARKSKARGLTNLSAVRPLGLSLGANSPRAINVA